MNRIPAASQRASGAGTRPRVPRVVSVLPFVWLLWGPAIPSAHAVVGFTWKDPCVDSLDCTLDFCWCEGDFDNAANWTTCCGGYPSEVNHRVTIERSNGSPYSDCSTWGNTCPEAFLQLNLIDEIIEMLIVQVKATAAADVAYVAFWGDYTLSCSGVRFDATNGDVVVEIGAGGRIDTY